MSAKDWSKSIIQVLSQETHGVIPDIVVNSRRASGYTHQVHTDIHKEKQYSFVDHYSLTIN